MQGTRRRRALGLAQKLRCAGPKPALKLCSRRVLAALLAASVIWSFAPGPANAGPIVVSPRPLPRPETVSALPAATQDAASPPVLAETRPLHRPLPRPLALGGQSAPFAPASPDTAKAAAPTSGGVSMTLLTAPGIRPLAKPVVPPREQPGTGRAPKPDPRTTAKGSVCGVPGLIGQPIPPIVGKVQGCGLAEGVKLTSVSGIRLSQPLTVDCPTAIAFKTWIDRGIVPAVGGKGGGLARLDVGPGYVCRPRNNQRGAKVSEHGRGRAIDLMGIVLQNGQSIDVARGWKSQSRMLRAIHASACGPFGTVLGPKADRYHQDHIHVDTARYRSGNYCR